MLLFPASPKKVSRLSLGPILRAGARSAVYTVVGISLTLAADALSGRIAGMSGPLSTLTPFGMAINDTSSVVGAASAYGGAARAVATTVKLTRALWIMPCVLLAAFLSSSDEKGKFPLFVAGFVAAAAVRTLLPSLQPLWGVLVAVARQSLDLTLFLIGAGETREVLRRAGVRPLAQGVVLRLVKGGATTAAIVTGLSPAL